MGCAISETNVSRAWLEATRHLLTYRDHQCWNLMVSIANPLHEETTVQSSYVRFCKDKGIGLPRSVAQCIFPKRLFKIVHHDRHRLYDEYPRIEKVIRGRWGSYFGQLTGWSETSGRSRNQIEDAIVAIRSRRFVNKTAYNLLITNPFSHFGLPRGGPCLHYVCVQLSGRDRVMSLLALYRNHDFATKAYGNYVGLGHLLEFLARETGFTVGSLTCVSNHAFIHPKHPAGLSTLSQALAANP